MSSTSPGSAHSQTGPRGSGLRSALIGILFALVLLVPKLLHLRRNPRSWMLFRLLLAVSGAVLVIVPMGWSSTYIPAIVGLAMFIAAILLPPYKSEISVDDKVRELGALVAVNGGRFKLGNAPSFQAQLFVGSEQVWVLDSHFQTTLEILVSEITSARTEETHGRWLLRVDWANKTAGFLYRGVFAEHLARVAETTLHSVMRPSLPVIPQRRAASA